MCKGESLRASRLGSDAALQVSSDNIFTSTILLYYLNNASDFATCINSWTSHKLETSWRSDACCAVMPRPYSAISELKHLFAQKQLQPEHGTSTFAKASCSKRGMCLRQSPSERSSSNLNAPVSMPRPSGEYARMPMPSSWVAGPSASKLLLEPVLMCLLCIRASDGLNGPACIIA